MNYKKISDGLTFLMSDKRITIVHGVLKSLGISGTTMMILSKMLQLSLPRPTLISCRRKMKSRTNGT